MRTVVAVAALAAVGHLAAVIFAFGMLSLLLDIEVVGDPAAGNAVGPVMTAVSGLVVLLAVFLVGRRRLSGRSGGAFRASVLAAVVAYLGYAVAGSVIYGVASGQADRYLDLAVGTVFSPFAIVVGVVAGLATRLGIAVIDGRIEGRPRAGWPWERDDR